MLLQRFCDEDECEKPLQNLDLTDCCKFEKDGTDQIGEDCVVASDIQRFSVARNVASARANFSSSNVMIAFYKKNI